MDGGVLFIILGALFLYFIPSIVAASRGSATAGSAQAINFFLGWTVIGWVVALAIACGGESRADRLNREGEQRARDERVEHLLEASAVSRGVAPATLACDHSGPKVYIKGVEHCKACGAPTEGSA